MPNPITFGKTFISKTPVIAHKTGKRADLNFVEYKDKSDLANLQITAQDWDRFEKINKNNSLVNDFSVYISEDFERFYGGKYGRFFGLEDNEGNIEAMCEVNSVEDEFQKNGYLDLLYFVVNPRNRFKSTEREYKKLGLALFGKVLRSYDKKEYDHMEIYDVSRGFWDKVPYIKTEFFKDKKIDSEDFSKCIDKIDMMI